ncbi:hypothetical protein ACVLV4_003023 [Rathayibacter agropyri]
MRSSPVVVMLCGVDPPKGEEDGTSRRTTLTRAALHGDAG